jgi:hypothetical protein
MRGSGRRRAFHVVPARALRRTAVAALAAGIGMLTSAGVASADTHTGYVLTITCGGETTTVVSPTSPAAASQDVASTRVIVLAYGALFAPESFPAGKVVLCDLSNLTTGNSFKDVPFLVTGAP